MQELPAYRVEVEGLKLHLEALGGGLVVRAVAAGLDHPRSRDRGVEALIEGGLAALVAQDVAVDAQRVALVAPGIGVTRGLPRVRRELADILLEAPGDAGGGDLAGDRRGRLALAGAGQHSSQPAGHVAERHQ